MNLLKKIVIADDNAEIRELLPDILIDKGYAIDTVKDGYRASFVHGDK